MTVGAEDSATRSSNGPAPGKATVICVAGMHRSGTSLVTRLLSTCGLYLGETRDLMGDGAANSDGFWEHIPIVDLNDRILAAAGGGWDYPPHSDSRPLQALLPPNVLPRLRSEARALIEPLNRHPVWGWKDPRNSLTLSFWRELIPDVKVIIPIRHPSEVAASLHKRDNFSPAFSHHLWVTYHRRILDQTKRDERLVTHFDALFVDTDAEIRRLSEYAALHAPTATIHRAASTVSARLRHNRNGGDPTAPLSVDVADLYDQLCQEATWPHPLGRPSGSRLGRETPQTALGVRAGRVGRALLRLAGSPYLAELTRRDRTAADLRAQLDDRIAAARNSGDAHS